MTEYAYIKGQIVPMHEANLNITDLSILRGYGVFDFFRAIEGQPIFMEDHLDRFENSTRLLGMKLPDSRAHIKNNILELIRLNNHPFLGIRLVCTGGYSSDGYTPAETCNLLMLSKPFTIQPFDKAMKLMSVAHQRDMPEIKTTNYIRPISLLSQLAACQADDVLYHTDGNITESSRSNIFVIKNGILITAAKGILLGITRKHILSFAHEVMPVEIRDVSLAEVWEADELFISGSTKRIAPVNCVDNTNFGIGRFTKLLYDRLIAEETKN